MTVSDSIIPAGGRFLPGHSVAGLRRRYGEEKDPATALRLLTYIKRKEGMSIRRICADLGRPYATIRNWLIRAAERGIAGWDGDVVLRHLPPYTRELNPVEVQWRMTRKAAANVLYADTDAMKGSVRRMLHTGEAGVAEMSHHLPG